MLFVNVKSLGFFKTVFLKLIEMNWVVTIVSNLVSRDGVYFGTVYKSFFLESFTITSMNEV